ncbi:MAG: metallophosphoesterase family protein, partial [Lachnospiraceae bacterium]|nr:metallophosphoesterase family protein [Lachnospiraceae bacterium]
MKLAVLSDIHSNYEAFKSCIDYLENRKVDAYVLLGDYVGELPCPEKTLRIIKRLSGKRKCYIIRGNKEEYIINGLGDINPEWDGYPSVVGMIRYGFEHATEEDVEFFKSLPTTDTVKIKGYPPIRICHGSTDSVKGYIERKPADFFDSIEEKYILCGHTHQAKVTYIADKVIWNPGSVGLSGSGEMIARCMILHGNKQEWRPEY